MKVLFAQIEAMEKVIQKLEKNKSTKLDAQNVVQMTLNSNCELPKRKESSNFFNARNFSVQLDQKMDNFRRTLFGGFSGKQSSDEHQEKETNQTTEEKP